MMHELLQTRTVISNLATPTGSGGPVVFTTTGDKFIFTPANPVKLLKWGVIFSTSLSTGANGLVLELDKRITAGSDTGRVDEVDTLTVAVNNTTYVGGLGVYRDPYTASVANVTTPASEVAAAGPLGVSLTIQAGQAQLQLKPGEEWVVTCETAASTAGQGYIWIEYAYLPISKPSGYGTTDAGTVSLTENLTRLAS